MMKLSHKTMGVFMVALAALLLLSSVPVDARPINASENNDFTETEQPELNEETKNLILLCQKAPTEENYLNLRDQVIKDYNVVLDRKKAKLAELKAETVGKPGGEAKVAEMEEIVQEMLVTYWSRINSSMLRFTDTRLLKWKIAEAPQYEYIPVMGAGESLYIKRTPVTNQEYAEFIEATGIQPPVNWTNGTYPQGEPAYPVNYVSYKDAQAYCAWLTEMDGVNTYRLPSESEWELAAGHMPKDADFNCGVNGGRTPVNKYEGITRGAHGAIDFWGNVWEWTSTIRANSDGIFRLGTKGGSWLSERTECRTEYRKESREADLGYEDVGFRVIQVLNGKEPEQQVELATLPSPVVSAVSTSTDSITLTWQRVDGAVEYQIYEYFDQTGLIQMLETVEETIITIDQLDPGSIHSYIVQPISYVAIADNISKAYSVKAICGSNDASFPVNAMEKMNIDGLNFWLYTPDDTAEKKPLIVYLHGITGKGDDLDTLLTSQGFVQWLADGTLGEIPAYVLIPQLAADQKDWIAAKENVVSVIQKIVSAYPIDSGNINLTGFSMGGAGVWNIAIAYPELFHRIAPLSGGVRAGKTTLSALSDMPIWTFVGTADEVVNPQSTLDFMEKLSQYNSQAVITQLEGAEHTDVPALAYLSEEIGLLDWLIEK